MTEILSRPGMISLLSRSKSTDELDLSREMPDTSLVMTSLQHPRQKNISFWILCFRLKHGRDSTHAVFSRTLYAGSSTSIPLFPLNDASELPFDVDVELAINLLSEL